MKVLITGSQGQLGMELQRSKPEWAQILATNSKELDISDPVSVNTVVNKFVPDVIVNAAAYTQVDLAEDEPEKAYLVNSQGVANLAETADAKNIRLIHMSTDFVFSGRDSKPYQPQDEPGPISVYGASKREGEVRLLKTVKKENATIIRTAWVYSSYGCNFVKTMLRLMAERDSIGVVSDQIGTPTWALGLSSVVWEVVRKNIFGIHHWTDAGVASWYDFAVAIQEEALALGLLKQAIPINPIRTGEFLTRAERPAFCVLDKTSMLKLIDIPVRNWRVSLRKMLKEV